MFRRRTRIVTLTAAGALLIGLTSWVTAGAVGSQPDGVRACRTAAGYLTLPSSAGHCPAGDQGVTIGRRGATGARGPAGAPGSAKALFDSGSVTLLAGAPEAPHGPQPTQTTVATLPDVPAGSYLIAVSLTVRNSSANLAEIDCSTQQRNPGAGTPARWSQTVGGDNGVLAGKASDSTLVSGSATGWAASPGAVTLSCLNYGATGTDASMSVDLTLTPVAAVRSSTG